MSKEIKESEGDKMLDYVVCECLPFADNLVYCGPVRLSKGDLDAIYVGPSGAFAIALGDLDPADVYLFLRDYLGTTRVDVYHGEKGRYNASGVPIRKLLTQQELDTAIYHHTTQGPCVWTEDLLETVQKKIRVLDGMNRGIYCDDDKNWFLALRGKFYPCSDHDANRIFRIGLFGGVLGLHRFVLRKWFTGLLYLLTGGLLGFGWALDVLQIAHGSFKDRKKRLLPKPNRLRPGWYIGGAACGLSLFLIYGFLLAFLSGMFDQFLLAERDFLSSDQAFWLISLMKALSLN